MIDKVRIEFGEGLEQHLADLGGGPYQYTVSGVQLDLQEWGAITIPLSLLAINEAKQIAPSYQRWLASQADDVSDEERQSTEHYERLALDSRDRQRRRYQNSPQRPLGQRQLKMKELDLLAAGVGVTDLWEVQIGPRNLYGYGRSVVLSARNSLLAKQQVAQRFPGWTIGVVVKRSY